MGAFKDSKYFQTYKQYTCTCFNAKDIFIGIGLKRILPESQYWVFTSRQPCLSNQNSSKSSLIFAFVDAIKDVGDLTKSRAVGVMRNSHDWIKTLPNA